MISTSQAEKLVKEWCKHNKSECCWKADSKLIDITTKEIRDRLHAQVFMFRGYTDGTDAFLVKDGKIYPMSNGFGGWGLTDVCVFDVNHDAKDELIYSYSYGSGMHFSIIEAYGFNGPVPTKIPSNIRREYDDLMLVKLGEIKVDIYTTKMTGDKKLAKLEKELPDQHLGELTMGLHFPQMGTCNSIQQALDMK